MPNEFNVLATSSRYIGIFDNHLKDKCNYEISDESYVSQAKLCEMVKGKDAIIVNPFNKINDEVLDAAGTSLKVVCTYSVGTDHLDVDALKKRNIKIGYTPGVLTDATAEFTVALLLATSRRLFEASDEIKRGKWKPELWHNAWLNGMGLQESTVGVFGLGRIGQAVVRMLKGFNVKRFIYTATSPKNEGDALGAEYVGFETLLKESDFIIVTASLNESTKLIFNAEAFRKMKKTAIFVNVARGGLVNQDDLLHSLQNGDIGAAGLDVTTPEPLPPSHPLFSLKNCVVMPHMATAEVRTRKAMVEMTVQNVLCGLTGQKMPAPL